MPHSGRDSGKLVHGYGRKGTLPVANDVGKRLPSYLRWVKMLKESYSIMFRSTHPWCNDYVVVEEWLDYPAFKAWYDEHKVEGLLMIKTGNVFGPQHCSFVTRSNVPRPRNGGRAKVSKAKLYGVGSKGDVFIMDGHGGKLPAYTVWKDMLCRCYFNGGIGTYKECSVCEEWLFFPTFQAWFDENYQEGYHLDKDITSRGNKTYCPEKCAFVPREINALLGDRRAARGDLPQGVSRKRKRFQVTKTGGGQSLGVFDTPEQAFDVYKADREAHIRSVALDYFARGLISAQIRDGLLRYQVQE